MADKLIICVSQRQALFDKWRADYKDNVAENHRSGSANGE